MRACARARVCVCACVPAWGGGEGGYEHVLQYLDILTTGFELIVIVF